MLSESNHLFLLLNPVSCHKTHPVLLVCYFRCILRKATYPLCDRAPCYLRFLTLHSEVIPLSTRSLWTMVSSECDNCSHSSAASPGISCRPGGAAAWLSARSPRLDNDPFITAELSFSIQKSLREQIIGGGRGRRGNIWFKAFYKPASYGIWYVLRLQTISGRTRSALFCLMSNRMNPTLPFQNRVPVGVSPRLFLSQSRYQVLHHEYYDYRCA